MSDVIVKMTEGRLGLALLGDSKKLNGIITDGDLRRSLVNNVDLNKLVIKVLINILPDTKTLPKPIIELKIFLTPEIFAAILPCTICLKPKL